MHRNIEIGSIIAHQQFTIVTIAPSQNVKDVRFNTKLRVTMYIIIFLPHKGQTAV